MASYATDELGWNILALLGVDTRYARKATIHIEVGDIVTAEVLFLARDKRRELLITKDGMDIQTVLKRYELKEKKDETGKMADNKP